VNGSSASRPGHCQDPFSAELIELLSSPKATRIRAELKLAGPGKKSRGRKAAPGAPASGIGGALAVYGVGYLVACAVIAVGGVMTPWLDVLIVGAGVLAAAGVRVLTRHRA
jgi:hypothetical protein